MRMLMIPTVSITSISENPRNVRSMGKIIEQLCKIRYSRCHEETPQKPRAGHRSDRGAVGGRGKGENRRSPRGAFRCGGEGERRRECGAHDYRGGKEARLPFDPFRMPASHEGHRPWK